MSASSLLFLATLGGCDQVHGMDDVKNAYGAVPVERCADEFTRVREVTMAQPSFIGSNPESTAAVDARMLIVRDCLEANGVTFSNTSRLEWKVTDGDIMDGRSLTFVVNESGPAVTDLRDEK